MTTTSSDQKSKAEVLREKAAELLARAKATEAAEKRRERKRKRRCAFLIGESALNRPEVVKSILPHLSASHQTYVRNVLGLEAPSTGLPVTKPVSRDEP